MSAGQDLSEEVTKAAMWGNLKLLESLLEAGADPNSPNARGDSPLHEAVYYGEKECAQCLLKYKGKFLAGAFTQQKNYPTSN